MCSTNWMMLLKHSDFIVTHKNCNHCEELEAKWASDKMLHFARFCWLNKFKTAPSGKIWRDVFYEKHGMHLDIYAKERKKAQSK